MKMKHEETMLKPELEYEHPDTEALKKRILAYRKMSEAMQRAAEAIRSKGGAKS